MNERIRKLAKKSGFSLDSTGIYTAKLEHLPITENMEKFAELIVKECAKFMDENSGYNDSNGCWFPEPEAMLKHFGFEE